MQLDDPSYKASLKQRINVFLANLLPMSIWLFVIPYTSSSEYILNNSGEILVDILCDYTKVSSVISEILVDKFNVYNSFELPSLNRSVNSSVPINRFESFILNIAVSIRLRRDVMLWKRLVDSGGILYSVPIF